MKVHQMELDRVVAVMTRYKTYISLHYNTLQFNSTTNNNSQNDRKVECLLNSSNKN